MESHLTQEFFIIGLGVIAIGIALIVAGVEEFMKHRTKPVEKQSNKHTPHEKDGKAELERMWLFDTDAPTGRQNHTSDT